MNQRWVAYDTYVFISPGHIELITSSPTQITHEILHKKFLITLPNQKMVHSTNSSSKSTAKSLLIAIRLLTTAPIQLKPNNFSNCYVWQIFQDIYLNSHQFSSNFQTITIRNKLFDHFIKFFRFLTLTSSLSE